MQEKKYANIIFWDELINIRFIDQMKYASYGIKGITDDQFGKVLEFVVAQVCKKGSMKVVH